jgi:hypothetical protein
MATTTLLSLSDYRTRYGRQADAADTVVTPRLVEMSAAIMRYIGWSDNDAGTLTLVSSTHTLTLPDGYALADAGGVSLPLAPITAIASVRVGDDTAGAEGVDYEVLTAGTDYRLQSPEPMSPRLRWIGGERVGELRVVCTAGWAAVPEDLVGVCGRLTAWSLALDSRAGRASVSDGQMATTSYRAEEWPPDAREALRPYLSPRVRVVRR